MLDREALQFEQARLRIACFAALRDWKRSDAPDKPLRMMTFDEQRETADELATWALWRGLATVLVPEFCGKLPVMLAADLGLNESGAFSASAGA